MGRNKAKKNIAKILIFIILFQYISMIAPFLSINLAIYSGEEWKTGTASDGSVWQYQIEDGNATKVSCVSYPYNPVEKLGELYTVSGSTPNNITNIPSTIKNIPIQSITVPSSIDGYTVVSFAGIEVNRTNLNEVLAVGEVCIPKTVTEILPNAFAKVESAYSSKQYVNYSNLRRVIIEEGGLTTIGANAFSDCTKLSDINIPDTVTTIGESAFENCLIGNGEVSLGKNVTTIGKNAFNISSLKSISIDSENASFISIDGVLYNKEKTNLIKYPAKKEGTTYEVLEGVTNIEENAFYNCQSLKSITMPNSVISIGAGAFQGCTALESVTLSNNLNSIEKMLFYNCKKLDSITLPESVKSIGERSFYDCSNLTKINIPSTVTTIENETFYGCSNLSDLTLPNGLTSIGERSFYGCRSLENITIPNSVTSIKYNAFGSCSKLSSIILSNSLSSIESHVFNGCSELKNISIPESVRDIGESAFYSSGLENIYVEKNNQYYTSIDGVLFDKGVTCLIKYPTKRLESTYIVPSGVNKISKRAFETIWNKEYKKRVILPSSIKTIEDENFWGDYYTIICVSGSDTYKSPDEVLYKIKFEDENSFNTICDKCKEAIVETYPENLELVIDNGTTELDISNCNIENLVGLESFSDLKVLNASNNSIMDLTPINELKLTDINLKNQKNQIDVLKKEVYLDILAKAKDEKYGKGTGNVVDGKITIENNTIKLNDDFSNNDTAKIGISGGALDGSVYTLKVPDDITTQFKIVGDKLVLIPQMNGKEIKNEDIDLYYSVDDNEYQKYEENTLIPEGEHRLKIKFFDKVILDEDIKVTLAYTAVRKNGGVYIYSSANANNKILYSFTGDKKEEFTEYTGVIENSDAQSIFLKIGDNNEVKEIQIQEVSEIHDIETKADMFDEAYRENGVVTLSRSLFKLTGNEYTYGKDFAYYYSFDKKHWTKIEDSGDLKINNIDADTLYIKATDVQRYLSVYNGEIMYFNIRNVSEDKYSEIIGTYTENNNSYIFGQDRNYSIEDIVRKGYIDHKYSFTSDYNDIQQVKSGTIIDMTTIMGKTLILKQDGKVYEIGKTYDDLKQINGAADFTQIDGIFAVDQNNDIWVLQYNYNDNTYEYINGRRFAYSTGGRKVEKLLSVMCETGTRPYILYTNGEAEIVGQYGGKTLIAENVIDISADEDVLYAMQYDKIICRDSNSKQSIDISELILKGEMPVRINKQGAILTNTGNYYEMTLNYNDEIGGIFKDEKLHGWMSPIKLGYYKLADIIRTYALTEPIKTGIAHLGDYTYQDKNGEVYYRTREIVKNYNDSENYKLESEEVKAYKEIDTNITVTKDESKLNENKVIINVEVPDNISSIKKPNGETTQEKSFAYEVTENGQYVFEYTDSNGNTGMKVVHVQTIQNRKDTKVPEVTALNGKIILESDDEIEYSLDNKNWNNYTQEIEYKDPIYARVKNENYECSILKITINETGHLDVKNTEDRAIQGEILTDAIGKGYNETINFEEKVDSQKSQSSTEEKKGFFNYISQIADNIIYTFSSTDGKYAGCYWEDNITEITYKNMDNGVSNIDGQEYRINQSNIIEYSVIYEENQEASDTEEEEKKKVDNGEIIAYEKVTYAGGYAWYWNETVAKYAYVDSEGNLVSNIDFINKVKEVIEKKDENIKYAKIVGDGVTFYILTEKGEVYLATSGENGNWTYLMDKLSINTNGLELAKMNRYHDIVSKLNLRNIVDIYDSATALTKDGKIVSLIKDNEDATSAVQELQSQTDKYLIISHLGLKDGKLYNFNDVQKGTEVTAGKLVESNEAKFGTYSESEKTITLFDSEYEKENPHKSDGEIYIDVQSSDDILPEFVDIAEYKNGYLTMPIPFGKELNTQSLNTYYVSVDYINAAQYALCYAVAKDGEIWVYIGGYIIDTGVNIDFFGPTTNYNLSNTKWTNQNISLDYTENTTNQIELRKVTKGDELIAENNTVTIEKNGTYNIEVSDTKGRSYTTAVKIANIDKVKPVVETKGTIQSGIVTLSAHDVEDDTGDYGLSGIANIKFTTEPPSENTQWTTLEEISNKDGVMTGQSKGIECGKKIYVIATDNAGNESDVTEVELERISVTLEKKVKGKTKDVNLNAAKKDDVLVYSVVVTNNGDTTIESVKLTDELLGINNKEYTFNDLKPGESTEIELGEYTVTQGDINKQEAIRNVVTAENGDGPSETETPVEPERKSVALEKKVAGKIEDVNLNAAKKDDVLVYSVVVTNKGNTTITSAKLTDELLHINDQEYTFDDLNPGESKEITLGEYTVTQEDINKQQPIKNVVTAENGEGPSETETPVEPERKSVALEKKVAGKTKDVNLNAAKKGDVLVYSVVVTNKGNMTITSAKLTDKLLNINNREYTFDELKPGESTEIALGEYTVSERDINKQQPIKNVVTAKNGEGPSETNTPVEPKLEDNKAPILPYTGLTATIGFTLIVVIISYIGVIIYKKRK